MEKIRFEWDEDKNQINRRKHGISFEEAKEVFYDDHAIVFDDPDHSFGEERFLIIGHTRKRLCVVSHCYRDHDNVIRLISARAAAKRERDFYFRG
ncbi:MAG: BrnT family toxin [Selenomonas sp.]|nr:BrnT family toxin [Selenomonas sp.]